MASKDADNPPGPPPESAPDPDEDDLDDLDEMLDEFSAAKIDNNPPASTAPGASGPGRPAPATEEPIPPPGVGDDDFADQLQSGMAQMLQDLESNPEMAKQFEDLMAQFGAPPPPAQSSQAQAPQAQDPSPSATRGPAPAAETTALPSQTPAAPKPAEENFQDTIRRTMDRMKASSSSADAAASTPADASPFSDDMMASLLRELQAADPGAAEGGDDSFSKMLLGMMEQLTNKEILYEPMKELNDKFPAWMEQKGAALATEERERYETQRGLVKEIVGRFERDGYSDANAEDREFIVERMQKMQAAGAPPPELVGDVEAANDMMAGMDQGCAQQ